MRRILVTGASSGIGLEVARQLIGRGLEVLMLSNDRLELDAACQSLGSRARAIHLDLSEVAQRPQLWAEWESEFGPIDGLVNNAGIGLHALLTDTPAERMRLIFEINFFAPALLCQQAARQMAERRSGSILNLTSASARRALAKMSAYASSKAALHSLTQTLRLEMLSYNVRVSEVLPISVSSRFFERTNQNDYRPKGLVQSSETVAKLVVDTLEGGPVEVCSHWPTAWGLGLDGLFPNFVSWLLKVWQRFQKVS